MSISSSDFEYVQQLVYKNAGIVLDKGKEYLLELRLRPVAKKQGFNTISELICKLRVQQSLNGMHNSVINALTTNETSFFRDLHPFEVLKDKIFPELIKKNASQRKLNIWCCACSSGQEPYTIAMILRENFPLLANWSVNILATDISDDVLLTAKEGMYNQLEVNRGLPIKYLVKYFTKNGNGWKVKDELRKVISFRKLNLLDYWLNISTMDIIFIRNILIYFDTTTKQAILTKLRRLMTRDSYLFLGSTETLVNIDDSFKWEKVNKTIFYKLTF